MKSIYKRNQLSFSTNTFATFLSQWISFPFQVPPVPLDVLHHGVLPGQLVVVGEVVDDLEIVHAVARVHREEIPNNGNNFRSGGYDA